MHARSLSHSLRALACALSAAACTGTTGDRVVDFEAVASGPADAVGSEPLSFEGSHDWQVTLTHASLHVGALYLAESMPASDARTASCVLPGNYVAQVVQGRDVDLLSGAPQAFPVGGRGTTVEARAGQVWLTGDDVNLANVPAPPTVILDVVGSARRGGELRPFEAKLTIADNRVDSGESAAGASPICEERIVSPVPTALRPESGGALWLRVDPRLLFTNVDFGALAAEGDVFVFKDDSSDPPSATLYENLKQPGPQYEFSWVTKLP